MKRKPPALKILFDVKYGEMQEHLDRIPTLPLGEIRDALEQLAQAAVWKAAYVSYRYGDGCGDQGHKAAVKHANARLRKVRKAMGFTYPERGEIRV